MNKLGIMGALAAVALMSSPTWASEQAPNTDDQSSTVATGPAITRVIAGRVSEQLANNARRATRETPEAASSEADDTHPDRATR